MEIAGSGVWAIAWESASRFQPNQSLHSFTWSPSAAARLCRGTSFHVHQGLTAMAKLKLFSPTSPLKLEGFSSRLPLWEGSGELGNVWKYRRKNLSSYVSLYFSIRQEDSTGYCNLSNPQTKQHRSVVNTDTWSQLQKSFHMKSFSPKESLLQFCDCFSRILLSPTPLGVYSC